MLREITIIVMGLSLTALAGCEKNPGEEYGKTVVSGVKRAERAADNANLSAIKQGIQAYYATNGKYPDSLEEIASNMDTSRFDYDPATGSVTIKK